MSSMWTRNQGDYTVADVDRWSDAPPGTFWAKWVGGVLIPLLLLWPAAKVLIHKTGYLIGQGGMRMDVAGTDAILLGSAIACLAAFLHTHYFWGNSRRLFPLYDLGKTVSLLGFCICAVWLVFRLLQTAFGVPH